jgi:hypothetical protein
VITRLQVAGLHVTAVQNPLTSVADDVAATQRVLDHHRAAVEPPVLEAAGRQP